MPPSNMSGKPPAKCVCKGRTQEGKSRCTQRIIGKRRTYSAEDYAHVIPDYDYVKGDLLSQKCYQRLMKEKIAMLASQEINSEDFGARLQRAVEDPDSKDAKALLKILTPVIRTSAAKMPFSPSERRGAATMLCAMAQFFGLPSIFFTFSPCAFDHQC